MAEILILDDVLDACVLMRKILSRQGHTAHTFTEEEEALKFAVSNPIDLAILDMILPDMGGKDVYKRIMKARPGLKVIVCSGYKIEGPPQDILDAGAEGFVQKPFHIATLAEKLKEVLERK